MWAKEWGGGGGGEMRDHSFSGKAGFELFCIYNMWKGGQEGPKTCVEGVSFRGFKKVTVSVKYFTVTARG